MKENSLIEKLEALSPVKDPEKIVENNPGVPAEAGRAPARVRKAVSITTSVLLNHFLGLRNRVVNPFVIYKRVANTMIFPSNC